MNLRDFALCFGIAAILISGCASTSTIKSSGNETVDIILHTADDLQGTSYCSSGTTPDCFDCSGFVHYCFASVNITLPRTTTELYAIGTKIDADQLVAGDLVFFNTSGKGVSHVGIYVGEGRFIHSSTSNGVMISALVEMYWKSRYLGCRRVVGV